MADTEKTAGRTIPEMSIDTQLLVDMLRNTPIGETVTYEAMREKTDRDIQNGARYLADSARRIVQREDQMLFGCVARVGFKRLANNEIVGAGQMSIDRIRREARRGAKRLVCAKYGELSREDQTAFNTSASALGALHAVTTRGGMKRLAVRASEAQAKLPLNKTLEAFQD